MDKSGIDIIRTWMQASSEATFEHLMGFTLNKAEAGDIEMLAAITPKYYNAMGRVHGGYCASLVDTAMGAAAISSLNPYRPVGTVGLNIHYVRKIDADSISLLCRANVLHTGRSMLTCEAKVHDAHGKLCAHASGTFLVYP
jgi:uncharacterized protein (TIGR00369 family)